MKSWPETLALPHPLREVRLAGFGPVPSPAAEDELRASFERGRLEGERALGEQLVQQRSEVRQLFDGILKSLRAAVPQVVHDTEQTVVALALEIARKLVGDQAISVEVVEAAVREALSQVEGTTDFNVRLHPADLEMLQRAASSLMVPPDGAPEVRFHASPDVSRGGCLVQTRFGVIDARRETKFDLMKRSLLA